MIPCVHTTLIYYYSPRVVRHAILDPLLRVISAVFVRERDYAAIQELIICLFVLHNMYL